MGRAALPTSSRDFDPAQHVRRSQQCDNSAVVRHQKRLASLNPSEVGAGSVPHFTVADRFHTHSVARRSTGGAVSSTAAWLQREFGGVVGRRACVTFDARDQAAATEVPSNGAAAARVTTTDWSVSFIVVGSVFTRILRLGA